MKRCDTRSSLPLSLLLAVAASGCVNAGRFDAVKAERDKLQAEKSNLEQRVEMLESANASLEGARFALIDEMEDLRQTHESLGRDVQRLERAEAHLSENLAAREVELVQRKAELASSERELAKLRGAYEGLVEDLEAEVASGRIQIEQLRDGLSLNLSQEIMFESGSANLAQGGGAVVRTVAERLQALPNDIEVRGHTDDVALKGSPLYPSNWELAAARAARVARLLVDAGVSPERLSVVSFGQYAPIASNDTPEGRAKNRRIEIALKPTAEAVAAEPEPPVAP
jgi:chemotaxis protein MotB